MTETAVIIGWDGAPFYLINNLLKKDELPNLREIAKEGYFGPLETVPYVMSSCAWSTFMTGKNAGKHGVYDFYSNEFKEGSYFRNPIDSTSRDSRDIGEIMNAKGRSVGMLNVPMTYPASEVDELMVSGMLTPSIDSDGFVHPDNFLKDFEEIDRYRIDVGEGKDADRDVFSSDIKDVVDTRFELVLYSIKKSEDLNVFFVVFTCPDRLSHYFMHFYDENHPFRKNETEEDLEKYGDVLPSLYRNLDEKLGEILDFVEDEYGEDLLVSVLSDHGMESLEKVVHMNKWLEEKGYLEFKDDYESEIDGEVEEMLDDKVEYIFGKVNWESTKAYSMGKRGAIYVNLEGREPEGSVKQEEYEEVIENLVSDLRELTDPQTDENIVEEVNTRYDLFHGKHTNKAPDVLISLSGGYYPFGYAFELDKPGFISTNDWEGMPFVTGIESGEGILAVSGEKIRSDAEDIEFSLMDYLPTLLHYFDHSVPEDMDGKVIRELFGKEHRGEVKKESTEESKEKGTDSRTDEDKQKVKDRLEDLGYL